MSSYRSHNISSQRQQYDWIHHYQSSPCGHISEIHHSQKFKKLDINNLRKAYEYLFKRHESLRTVFFKSSGVSLTIKQKIYPYQSDRFFLPIFDLSQLDSASQEIRCDELKKDLISNFENLSKGPLATGQILKINKNDYVFLFACHHIIADIDSIQLFFKELNYVYNSLTSGEKVDLAPIHLSCNDFLIQREKKLDGAYGDKLREYWRNKFKFYEKSVEKKTLYHRFNLLNDPNTPTSAQMRRAKVNMDHCQWKAYSTIFDNIEPINNIAKKIGTTYQGILMGCFFITLHLCYGIREIMSDSIIPGRDRRNSINIIGNLYCNVHIKSFITPSMTMKEILMKIYLDFLQCCRYPIFNYDNLTETDLRSNCEFFINFININNNENIEIPEVQVDQHSVTNNEHYSMNHLVYIYKNAYAFSWKYQQEIYSAAIVESIAQTHLLILNELINSPSTLFMSLDKIIERVLNR